MGAVIAALYISMSAIKNGKYPIELDKERHLLFSLNALDEIQDKFGGFDRLGEIMDGKDKLKNVRWLLTLLINEGADDEEEQLTEKQVGKLIHTGNFVNVQQSIYRAFAVGNNGGQETEIADKEDDEEEDKEKNSQSGQVK